MDVYVHVLTYSKYCNQYFFANIMHRNHNCGSKVAKKKVDRPAMVRINKSRVYYRAATERAGTL